jgi:nitroreductase
MTSLREMALGQRAWPYATAGVDQVRKIPAATWQIIERALVPPPCAYGLLPWVFVVVGDLGVRAQLRPPSAAQALLLGCSQLVVFARNTTMSSADVEKFIHRDTEGHMAQHGSFRVYSVARSRECGGEARGISVEEWTARQVYVALSDLMTSANLLGVEACPMDSFDPAQYDEVLGLARRGFSTVCACALGYRTNDLQDAAAVPACPPLEPTTGCREYPVSLSSHSNRPPAHPALNFTP